MRVGSNAFYDPFIENSYKITNLHDYKHHAKLAKILFFNVHFSFHWYRGFKNILLQKSICQGGSTSDPHDFTLSLCARLCWDCYCTVLPHNKMKKTREANERSSEELRKGLFSCLPVGGHSIITWISFLPFLTAYLPWRGQSLTRTWTKTGTYINLLTTYQAHSVNVIFEWPWLLLLVNCGVSRTINHWFWTFWSSSKSSSFQAFPLKVS